MLVYLDSSALVKRSIEESDSHALESELDRFHERSAQFVSSSLAWVEVTRAIRSRVDGEPPARVSALVDQALAGVSDYPIDDQVVSVARLIGSRSLRSLDAIHVTTAILVQADLLVSYDERLITAGEELGLQTSSPAPISTR